MKNKPVLVLMGPAASGKTAIANRLQKKYGYHKVITYTTRKRRDNEDELAYHFVSKEKFLEMIDNDEFYEYDIFGDCYYGTKNEEFTYPTVLILTVKGFKSLSNDLNCVPVYLQIEKGKQIYYLQKRGMTEEQIHKRLIEDEHQIGWLPNDVYIYNNDKDIDIVVDEIDSYFKENS